MRLFGLFLTHPRCTLSAHAIRTRYPHTLSAHAIRTALLLFRGAAEEM